MNDTTPRSRFVVGSHVVCLLTGRAGQILARTPEKGLCIVRLRRSNEVLTANERDLRFADWSEVRADQSSSTA